MLLSLKYVFSADFWLGTAILHCVPCAHIRASVCTHVKMMRDYHILIIKKKVIFMLGIGLGLAVFDVDEPQLAACKM